MLSGSANEKHNGYQVREPDQKRDISSIISSLAFDFSEFVNDSNGREHVESLTGQGILNYGYNGDLSSPPSPATIASTTDISGGDYLPPGTLSSQQSSFSNNAQEHAYHIHRARSISQPTAYVSRKSNLSVHIPPPPHPSLQTRNSYTPFDGSAYNSNAMTGFTPAYPESPVDNGTSQDYFNMPTTDGDVMMSVDPMQDQPHMSQVSSKPLTDVRYGYRLPASQPSSPVRSGYPPGQAPYAGHHQAQGRPRGFTTSDVHNHFYSAIQSARTPTMQPQIPSTQQLSTQPASPYQFSPVENNGYNMNSTSRSMVGTPQSAQMVTVPGNMHSPYANMLHMQATAQVSPMHPTTPSNLPAVVVNEVPTLQAMIDGTNLPFNQPTPINYRMAEPVLSNPVPYLENQAMSYGVGMQDIQVDTPPSNVQVSTPGPISQMPNSASRLEDSLGEAQLRNFLVESRRTSGSVVPSSTGLHTPGPSIPPGGFAMSKTGASTPDISKQVQDKLNFLDTLANSVAQARQEILLGHSNAADEYITDVGNAIIEKALSAENISNPSPSLNLQLPGIGSIVSAQQASSLAPSPVASLSMTPINQVTTPAPPSSDIGMPVPILAPPFELKRSRSVKRAAPESPLMNQVHLANKHIKLDELGMQEITQSPGSIGPGTPGASQSVHSHPFSGGYFSQVVDEHPKMVTSQPSSPFHAAILAQTGRPLPMPSPLCDASGSLMMGDTSFSSDVSQYIPSTMGPTSQESWAFLQNLSNPNLQLSNHLDMATNGQFPSLPNVAPRKGSIVDGRLISNRPGIATLLDSVEGRTMSNPVLTAQLNNAQQIMASSMGMNMMSSAFSQIGGHAAVSGSAIPSAAGFVSATHGGDGIAGTSGSGGDGDVRGEANLGTLGGNMALDSDSDSDDEESQRKLKRRRSSEQPAAVPGSLIQPPDLISDEMRAQLDRILFNFLNKVCSDLDYHDAKGELLHQVLMPKKMAKLDESTDFRPFKFRIQAFTNAFAEELQRLGVLEETLSAKKIKSYLWNQKLISRFNEDGKKSKSKGNHIWNVDAKKMPEGSWVFREFKRKIAPSAPHRAYVGAMYSWSPRVWDPQASTSGLKVTFSSPTGSLPAWLSWDKNVLSGVPTEAASSIPITTVAFFDDSTGVEHQLSVSFVIEVTQTEEQSDPNSSAGQILQSNQLAAAVEPSQPLTLPPSTSPLEGFAQSSPANSIPSMHDSSSNQPTPQMFNPYAFASLPNPATGPYTFGSGLGN